MTICNGTPVSRRTVYADGVRYEGIVIGENRNNTDFLDVPTELRYYTM